MAHDAGQTCPCVMDHRPKVVELDLHHLLPLYLGGPDTPENRVWICPNTHRAVHELLRLYFKTGVPPEQTVLDDYPRFARALASRAWAMYWQAQT